MRLAKGIAFFTLLLIASVPAAFAGDLHPALAAKMDATPADEAISVIVIMADQAPIAQMNEALKIERASLDRRHREVVLSLQDTARSQNALKAWLDSPQRDGSVLGYTGYWIANMMVVKATPLAIEAIAMRSDVDFVELNFTAELIEPVAVNAVETAAEDAPSRGVESGITACNVPQVWHELGITGEGALIGSCDTGVDGNHPALSARWRGNHAPASECWFDNLGSSTFPNDGHGHGTHTTGTMTGVSGSDSIGVAPAAEWIANNAIDQGTSTNFDNDIIESFQWYADPDGDPFTSDDVPDVVQNSWGVNENFTGYYDCDTRWWAVIDNCEAAGVVTTWSAGNEGPGGTSLRSPADRATTEFNCFSVGAVDAPNGSSFPYGMASFSSRGPTGCDVAPELKIKPEIVAPGVNVRSAYPGGGYTTMSGTSMAGPHLAGVVALMRSANPDLDVDSVKLILMQTARDQDGVGEDNTSGWGMVDAYAAVLGAMSGYGDIEGAVTNASWGGAPLDGATVELLGTSFDWTTDGAGYYSGMAAADTYTARASRPGFASQDVPVVIDADMLTVQDFSLTDIAGPEITNVTDFGFTSDTVGPYAIDADVDDPSTVGTVTLHHRVNNGTWMTQPMLGLGTYSASIPGAPAHSRIDYYVTAEDGLSQSSTYPIGAPITTLSLYITELEYSFDAESGNGGWVIGDPGDAATTGIWENADPQHVNYNGTTMQPEDDHTVDPGSYCFVTGPLAGTGAGDYDVDGGCTTLYSPVFDLGAFDRAFVSYWRWYAEDGFSTDDDWVVEVTDDGNAWVELERVSGMANSWQRVAEEIGAYVNLTGSVQFRFLACDLNNGGLVEAAIDDFGIETLIADLTALPGDDAPQHWSLQLSQSRPNPFHPGDGPVTLRFSMAKAGPATVQVYDIAGRLVRTLAEGGQTAGEHSLHWDGKDDAGYNVSSGVYFYRLQTGGEQVSKSLVLIR